MSSERRSLPVALALICVIGSGMLLYLRQTIDGASPRSAVRHHVDVLSRGDLEALKASSTPGLYLRYQTEASELAFESARRMFTREIPAYAEPIWRRIRDEGRSKAAEEYEALRPRVQALGRSHYQTLPASERARIVQSGTFEQSVFQFGVDGLPPEERSRIPSAQAFYRRADKESYVRREAWRHLPLAVQAMMSGPSALADEETAAKLAYFDRLASEIRERHPGVERADMISLGRFVSVHGEKLLAERLAMAGPVIPGAEKADCDSVAFAIGFMLHGPRASCSPGSGVVFGLQRATFQWLVASKDGFTLGPSE